VAWPPPTIAAAWRISRRIQGLPSELRNSLPSAMEETTTRLLRMLWLLIIDVNLAAADRQQQATTTITTGSSPGLPVVRDLQTSRHHRALPQ